MQACSHIKENEFKNVAINIVIRHWEGEETERKVKRRNSENVAINVANNI
jgi:hypothetical protein